MSTITIKPYPQPNPVVAGSRSRFAVEVIELNGVRKDRLAPADPECPVSAFRLDPVTGTGYFEREVIAGKPQTKKGRPISPYIPAAELIELVRLAQILQRPILIKGEPGSGKTQLARSVAYEWYGAEYKEHFFEWPVKSTSRAVDGLYTFDHIARLRNVNFAGKGEDGDALKEDLTKYREFGPMGKAFLTSTADSPSILLIDEIDKADIDFPNDLLLELDERRFSIPSSETGELIEARYPPLIFITSNDERELPEAFLRRCLFLYINFPEEAQLLDIIRAHLPGLVERHSEFVRAAIERFKTLRDEIKKDPTDNKRVSTSEFLDWLTAYDFDSEHGKQERIREALDDLPHYYQALLKTYQAVNRRQQGIDKKTTTGEKKPPMS